MLVVTPAIANLIREGKTFRINSSIQTGRKFGMMLLDDSLSDPDSSLIKSVKLVIWIRFFHFRQFAVRAVQ